MGELKMNGLEFYYAETRRSQRSNEEALTTEDTEFHGVNLIASIGGSYG